MPTEKNEDKKNAVSRELLMEAIKTALPSLGERATTAQVRDAIWLICEAEKNDVAQVMFDLGYSFRCDDALEWDLTKN